MPPVCSMRVEMKVSHFWLLKKEDAKYTLTFRSVHYIILFYYSFYDFIGFAAESYLIGLLKMSSS